MLLFSEFLTFVQFWGIWLSDVSGGVGDNDQWHRGTWAGRFKDWSHHTERACPGKFPSAGSLGSLYQLQVTSSRENGEQRQRGLPGRSDCRDSPAGAQGPREHLFPHPHPPPTSYPHLGLRVTVNCSRIPIQFLASTLFPIPEGTFWCLAVFLIFSPPILCLSKNFWYSIK